MQSREKTGLEIFYGPKRRLEPVRYVYLFENIVYMGFNRMRADTQLIGNFLIAGTGRYQGKNLGFPPGQIANGFLFEVLTFLVFQKRFCQDIP